MGSDIFGALFASVSGLDAQSTNLSIIANNIANANTTGYKGTQVEFQTLVSGSGSDSNYASGGVTADNRQLIAQQGLLQSTSSNTDIAIQGNGLFVVNTNAAGTGNVQYTRAGSFTQDSSGNFVNAAGYYLQAWPLDPNGQLPGAPGNTTDTTSSANLSSLQTVNVENVAGKAQPTSTISVSANLNAGTTPYAGAAGTVDMDVHDATNQGIAADTVIIPDSTDSIAQGDTMKITTGQNSAGYTYTYGGIAYSRNVTATAQTLAVAANSITGVTSGTNTITIAGTPPSGLAVGDAVTLSGATAIEDSNGAQMYSAGQLNGTAFTVTAVTPTGAGAGYTLAITNNGNPLYATGGAAASGTVSFTANPSNNDAISLNGVTWTFTTTNPPGTNQTLIQGTKGATMTQLAADLNASTNPSIDVATYTAGASGITIHYKTNTTTGNGYALSTTSLQGAGNETLSGAALTGGLTTTNSAGSSTQGGTEITQTIPALDYGNSDAGLPAAAALTGGTVVFTPGSNIVTINQAPPAGLAAGQLVHLSGDDTALNGLTQGALNGDFYVNSIAGNGLSYTITLPSTITTPQASDLSPNSISGVSSGSNLLTVDGVPPTGLAIGDTVTLSGIPSSGIADSNGVQLYSGAQLNNIPFTVTSVTPGVSGSYTVAVTNTNGDPVDAAGGTVAAGNIGFDANPSAGDTLNLNGQTWTFVASNPGALPNETVIGANLGATLTALASDLTTAATAGNTDLNTATYSVSGNSLVVTSDSNSVSGNSYVLGSAVTTQDLAGGVDGTSATGFVGFTGNPTNTQTITLDGQAWEFVTDIGQSNSVLAAAHEFAIKGGGIGATLTAAAAVLNSANFSGNPFGGAGYVYGISGSELTVTAPATDGAGPNTTYSLSAGSAATSVSGATLSGGVDGTPATGSMTLAANPTNGQSININGTVWTFVSGAPSGNQAQIVTGGSASANLSGTLANLASALNASMDTNTAKATYTVSPASPASTTLNLTAALTGVAGDSISFSNVTPAVTGGTVNGAATGDTGGTLAGGVTTTNSGGTSTQGGTAVTEFVNSGGTAGATASSRLFSGDILDATSPTDALITTPSDFTTASLSFSITTTTGGTSTFTYTSAAPNAALGQFSTLNNLATAISSVSGLSAKVLNNQLYISSSNGDDQITFQNGSTSGSDSTPPLGGIDWVGELGLATIQPASNRFSTMQGLANLVNNSSGLTGTVNNPLSASSVKIDVNDPLDTISFADGAGNSGSLLGALGLAASLNGAAFTAPETAGPYGPAYNPASSATNMASGAITPQFSREVTVYDSLGAAHELNMGFISTGTNTWAVEVYAQPATDVDSTLPNGQVAYGTLTFNGDGSLESVTSLLAQPISIDWTDGATPSTVSFDWGTAGAIGTGQTNGMSQFDSAFSVNFVNQNGASVGSLTGVSIGSTGLITASFSNGQTQNLYQIPIATFSDPDELQSISGNVFAESSTSGQVNLQIAGNSDVGTIASSSLEQSNVELADQLTNMIVAQQAYQANTKVISTADNLLTSLDQIFQ